MIPAYWATVTVGDLIDAEKLLLQNGFPQGEHNQSGRGVIHLRPFNVSEDGTLSLNQTKYVPRPSPDSPYWVERGDVIFNNTNSEELVGKTAFCDEEGAFVLSNHMTILRVLDPSEIEARWLARHLHFLWETGEFRKLCRRHVNQASVGVERLRSVELPLPPLREQKAIARALDAAHMAKQARQRELSLERERKAALMEYLFTHGTRGEPRKQTEIGEIPESWRALRLEDVAVIERGKFAHRPRNAPEFYGGNIPFIQTGDVANSNGHIRTYTQTLNEQGLSISRIFPKGTIVITIAANIGFTGILEFDSAFPDSLIGITPKEAILPEYLNYYFVTQQPEMDRKAPRGTQKNINIEFLKPWPVLVPPLEEQATIAEVLQGCDLKLDALHRENAALEELFRAMLEQLMTGRLSAVPLVEEHQAQ